MRSKTSTSNSVMLVLGILILFIGATLIASSQEQKNVQPRDTSASKLRIDYSEPLFPKLSFLPFQPLDLYYQPPVTMSHSMFSMVPEKIDLVSPWKLQLANQEKYATWRTIMGSIQLGGVAYIAYQHIKKYGLK